MEARRLEETDPEALQALRRGCGLAREEFRQKMPGLMEGRRKPSGELPRETAEPKANEIALTPELVKTFRR